MAARTEVNIGGTAQLDVVGARRGSLWRLVMTLTFTEEDDVDVNDIDAATLWLKPGTTGGDEQGATLELDGVLTVVDPLTVVVVFEHPADDTPNVPADTYRWDWELTSATNERLDGWAPTAGYWTVDQRVVERGGS